MEENFTDWQAKAKWLAQILIISITLNAGLVATLCYFAVRDKKTFMSYELKPLEERPGKASLTQTNEEVLGAFSLLSFDDLIRTLKDKTLVEEGYTKRDLALTCLVSMHHFDFEKALPHLDQKPKQATFIDEDGSDLNLVFYPNLTDQHFDVIRQFAKQEKYPITTEGLFKWLQATPTPPLKKAFARTFEFQALKTLFTHTGDAINDDAIFDLILSTNYQTMQKSIDIIRHHPQFTLETKRDVLTCLMRENSAVAASILVDTDFHFAAKRLSNPDLTLLMDLLPAESIHYKALAAHVQDSLRDIAIETPPAPSLEKPDSKRVHIIADGDTLWDISRHYKISLDELKKANSIESEYRLRPGNKLMIPQG